MSKISYGPCDLCGDSHASVAPLDDQMVCRACNPDNWLRVSALQKDAWLNGEMEKPVWQRSGHSQR